MAIRTIWIKGEVPYTKNFGTLAELLALAPSTEFAEGFASDHGRIDWAKGSGWMSGGKLLSADGSTSFAGMLRVAGGVVAPNVAGAHNQIRVAIDGDSIAEKLYNGGFLDIAIAASHGKFIRVANQAVGGSKAADVDARILSLAAVRPDEVWISIGVNDQVLSESFKASYLSILAKIQSIGARPVVFLPSYYSSNSTNRNNISAMNEWIDAVCRSLQIECNQVWDKLLVAATGNLDASKMDALIIHPIWSERKYAGEQYAARRVLGDSYRRNAMGLYLGKWAADPFNTTGSGTQGSRWVTGTATNATATYSKVSCVFPDVGNWQRVSASLSAVAGATLTWNCNPNSGLLVPEGEFEVSYRIKCSSFSNLSLDAYVWFRDDAGVAIGNRVAYHAGIRGDLDGTINMIVQVPAGVYQPQLAFTATPITDGSAATGDIDVAMIGMKSLVP